MILSSMPFSSHLEQADGLDEDQATGKRRLVQTHERVQGVAILAESVAQVAVVGRVRRGAHQQPVELDAAEMRIVLVLVARTLGDLDNAHHSLPILTRSAAARHPDKLARSATGHPPARRRSVRMGVLHKHVARDRRREPDGRTLLR